MITKNSVWSATSGGLFHMTREGKDRFLESNTQRYPDLKTTVLEEDKYGTLWIGTSSGYLYSKDAVGNHNVYDTYYSVGWDIKCLYSYDDFLLVGSSKGISVFSLSDKKAIQSSPRIGNLSSASILSIIVHNKILYIGLETGFATINLSNKSISGYNFFDNTIWEITKTDYPVVSFVILNDTVLPRKNISAVYKSKIYYADTTVLKTDTNVVFEFPSDINTIVFDDDGECWVGTAHDYLFKINGTEPDKFKIPGITFNGVDRVFVAKDGRVWFLPLLYQEHRRELAGFKNKIPWYIKVFYYDNGDWVSQDPGWLGSGSQSYFHGICEDRNGDIWLATYGYNDKYLDIRTNKWKEWSYGTGASLAIAQDSSGIIWFGNSYSANTGGLIGIRPKERGNLENVDTTFWFLDKTYSMENIYSLNVDQTGRIFVGGLLGELEYFTHNGHPIEQGEKSITKIKKFSQSYGVISNMVSTSDTVTWFATGLGLYRFDPHTEIVSAFEGIKQNVTSIVAENKDILWLGTDAGVLKLSLFDSSQTVYDINDGLVSNSVTDLSIDRRNGYLWIGTSDGISKFDMGHKFSVLENNNDIEVYPNPYSFVKNESVIFRNIKSGSRLFIVSIDGKVITEVKPLIRNNYSWVFEWKPSSKIVPGTYFYAVRSPQKGFIGKLLLIP